MPELGHNSAHREVAKRQSPANRHLQWGNNSGMIVLEWDRKDPTIRFQIIDEEGDIAVQRKIQLSTLQPGLIP